MKKAVMLIAVTALAGCQTLPPPADAMRAACVTQKYLLVNGYLESAPAGRTAVTLTQADVETYEDGEGALDYLRLVKDRSRKFSGKLRAVTPAPVRGAYTVVYGPVGKAPRRCLGVNDDFKFAFFADGACRDPGPLVRLRERGLVCAP